MVHCGLGKRLRHTLEVRFRPRFMREPTSAPAVSSGDMAWVISVSWFGSLFVSVSGPLEDRRLRASIWDQGLAKLEQPYIVFDRFYKAVHFPAEYLFRNA
jgi:hypothetical protein